MDDIVRQAMAKWPNVPAVYGWLALDRRGIWLLKRETIGNAALNAFISRNYQHDAAGHWYFQNGPQRVFVDLDYTPFVYRVVSDLHAPLALATHIGDSVNTLHGAWIDEHGAILLHTDKGIGVVHDQDIDPLLMAAMIDANGNVIAAINISCYAGRVPTDTLIQTYLPRIRTAAQAIDRELKACRHLSAEVRT